MKVVIFLDGSPESLIASEFAIALAKLNSCSLLAQTVVDRKAIVSLTGFQGFAGLCGSGIFIDAHDKIVEALIELNESILLAFCARAEGQGVEVSCKIDEGALDEIISSFVSPDVVHVLNARMLPSARVKCPTIVIGDKGRLDLLGTGRLVTNSVLQLLDVKFPEIEVGLPQVMEAA